MFGYMAEDWVNDIMCGQIKQENDMKIGVTFSMSHHGFVTLIF